MYNILLVQRPRRNSGIGIITGKWENEGRGGDGRGAEVKCMR
jgi:hypothetical protein